MGHFFGDDMGRRRYRQLFLFLAILILPGIMIAVQGWRLSLQEQELARTRLAEIRKKTAAEIGQEIVSRLERIKTQEMANMPGASIPKNRYSDPAVVAVGWVDGERLVWPWDINSSANERAEENSEFARAINEGGRAEYAEKRYDRATELYRKAAEIARHDTQRAVARLGVARALLRAGQRTAAVATYREVLKLPSTVTDDSGLSYWSYAATQLVELGAGLDVLERVNGDLESAAVWPSVQIYRFRTILAALRSSREDAVKQSAGSALEKLSALLADRERAETLQKDFQKLPVSSTDWQPYKGSELWLIGRAPEGATAKPLVLAVRWEPIRKAVEIDRMSRQAGPPFQIEQVGAGETLSQYLPGLQIRFPDGIADEAAAVSPQRSFWGLSLTLVAVLTLLGGYLLWRDVRREAHLAELRTQFVSSVSHELKTPLTSIRMFAELLQMRESNDTQQTRFLDTIVSETERLTRLLNNVLDFSRIERGQKTYRLEPMPLADVIQAAVRTIQYPLTQQGFVLDLNVCEGIPPVAVDRDALQQAILNLLTNAMKYSGENRKIGLRLCAENGAAFIEVSDRGIGIPEGEHARIFEKFYRVPIPENREISGTGLGLSLVAPLFKAHGGGVHVKSRPGEGSTFTIRLPLSIGPTVRLSGGTPASASSNGLSDGSPTPQNVGGSA
jgi:signal transduction histidine kinase